jgi:hypothetical protein
MPDDRKVYERERMRRKTWYLPNPEGDLPIPDAKRILRVIGAGDSTSYLIGGASIFNQASPGLSCVVGDDYVGTGVCGFRTPQGDRPYSCRWTFDRRITFSTRGNLRESEFTEGDVLLDKNVFRGALCAYPFVGLKSSESERATSVFFEKGMSP